MKTFAQVLQGSRGQILGPKLTFSKISSEPRDTFFLIFCMKLDTNKTLPTMYLLPLGKLLPRPHGG